MDQFNEEINVLLAQYRGAISDPDPSADFMPKLWGRIEARRGFTLRIKKLTQLFLAGAAAMCLVMTGALVLPASHKPPMHSTYVDILAEAHPAESLAALGIVRDPSELNRK
jgi:hypothetical protein